METQYPLKIEFVCTANCGRSVPSEIFANRYLKEINADDRYVAISSGTSVDDIAAGNIRPDTMIGFVKKGLERGIYNGERSDVEKMVNLDIDEVKTRYKEDHFFRSVLKTYYGRAAEIFEHEEHANRYEAMKERGLLGMLEEKIRQGPHQTVPRDDVIAIFPMAESNLKAVERIYAAAGKQLPYIHATPKAYVLEAPNAQVPDCFGEESDKYMQMIVQLEEYIPRAAGKAIFEWIAHDIAVKKDINNPANQREWSKRSQS